MKNWMIALSISLVPLTSFAESLEKKSLHVNFNTLIDESSSEKSEINDGMGVQYDRAEAQANPERQKVIDFLDMEIGIGSAPNLVDRRAN